jgi:hypothetical protein
MQCTESMLQVRVLPGFAHILIRQSPMKLHRHRYIQAAKGEADREDQAGKA